MKAFLITSWMLASAIAFSTSIAFTHQPHRHARSQQEIKPLSASASTTSTQFRYKKRVNDKEGVVVTERVVVPEISIRLALQDRDDAQQSHRLRTIPHLSRSRVAHSFNTIRMMLADVLLHAGKGHHSGTQGHIAIMGVEFFVYVMFMRKSVGTGLCRAVMSVTSWSLIYDNFILAIGKYIGEGTALRKLSIVRNITHGLCIPLLFLPVLEIISKHGVASASMAKFVGCLLVGFALHEFFHWMFYDHKKLILVDNRHSASSTASNMPGTMHYTCGKKVKMLLPVATLQVSILAVGTILWRRGATPGLWMLVSSGVSVFTCSLRRPGLQALGEMMLISLLWFAVAQ